MTVIDLLRHGETTAGSVFCGSTDVPLNEQGRLQMWAAVEKNRSAWDLVITTPLARCADFAAELGRRHDLPVVIEPRLQEMHFGAWEGLSAAEILETDADAMTRFWRDPIQNTPPGAEALAHFETRIVDAWREIVNKHAGRRILIVSHGGTIRMILCHVMQHPIKQLLEFEVAHGSMRRIRVDQAGRYDLDSVGDVR